MGLSQQNLKVALSGSTGRMGRSIQDLVSKDSKLSSNFKVVHKLNRMEKIETWKADDIDLVIDFSLPEVFAEVFKWCQENKKPLLSGTTGFSQPEKYLKAEGLNFAFLYSGNYSLGIASLIDSLKSFKKLSNNATVWMEDYHHMHKKDAPSGTALKIAEAMKTNFQKDPQINDVRAGSIFGIHKVHIATEKEWVTLSHTALSREVFSEGALNSAAWLVEQDPGLYTLEDFLN